MHLRNAPTKLMKELGYGEDYKYAHSYEGNYVDQNYLPDALNAADFYIPGHNAKEHAIEQWLKEMKSHREGR
jgi:putative ATPase